MATIFTIVTHHLALAGGLGLSLALMPGVGLRVRPQDEQADLAPLVAIVGCDGSGKSTLTADMKARFGPELRVETCYLGLGSGELGERIKRLPLLGVPVERYLSRKAGQTRTKGERIPGAATAIAVYAFSMLRRRRFREMLALRRNGVMVIADRYPQTEVPGFYDGPGLSAARAGSRMVGWLAGRERRMYQWMASYHPDIVVRLNVDVATAHDRKPDHKLDLLRRKVVATSQLRFDGAPIVDLDATAPYDEVRGQVCGLIAQVISHAGRHVRRAA